MKQEQLKILLEVAEERVAEQDFLGALYDYDKILRDGDNKIALLGKIKALKEIQHYKEVIELSCQYIQNMKKIQMFF